MPEFAKLQDNSVLEGTQVASKAGGHEAASQVFGMVSKAAFQKAESVQSEHSNAMLMNANAQASSVSTDAMIRMKTNPGQAEQILKETEASFNTIKDAQLNSTDRSRLNYLIQGNQNKLKMSSAGISIQQNRLHNNMNFYSAYNENMSQLQHALSTGDFNKADIIQGSLVDTAKNAMMDQTISPQAFQKIQASVVATHDRAQQLHDLVSTGDANALNVNKANYDMFSGDNSDLSDKPYDHSTAVLANHHQSNYTDKNIDKAIYAGQVTPDIVENLFNQSPEKFTKNIQKMTGSISAHSAIQSNSSMVDIDKRINELNNKTDLSSAESAELHVFQDYKKGYEGGDFISVISNSALGAKATDEWNEEKAAINDHVSYELSTEAQANLKQSMLAKADNNHTNKVVAIAEAMHMDPNKIRPILPNVMNDVKSSFLQDGDPQQAINQIAKLDNNTKLIGYMANQTKDPIQKEVIYSVGLGHNNNMKPEFQNNFIAANQAGRDFNALKSEGKTSDATIIAQIKSNTSDIMNQLTISGGNKAASRVNGFTKSALNYVKYRAMQNGDLDISNADAYIHEFTEQMGSAYNISNRRLGSFNNSQIQLSTADQDMVQHYAVSQARKAFIGTDEDSLDTRAGLLKTDFNVYIDETNNVIAKDQAGNTFYHAPYSDQLLSAAKHYTFPVQLSKEELEEAQNFARRRAPMMWGD